MSYQRRRRGQPAVVYPSKIITDNRNNHQRVVDLDKPIPVEAVFIPQRSARAEVPGQAQINVTRMILNHDLPGVDIWGRVQWQGEEWDIVSPPAYHHGTRHTRHWSMDIRERT